MTKKVEKKKFSNLQNIVINDKTLLSLKCDEGINCQFKKLVIYI